MKGDGFLVQGGDSLTGAHAAEQVLDQIVKGNLLVFATTEKNFLGGSEALLDSVLKNISRLLSQFSTISIKILLLDLKTPAVKVN